MKVKFSIYILIAIWAFVKSDEDVTTKKIDTLSTNSTTSLSSDTETKDTKEKRQLDRHQTAIHPHHNSRHHQSSNPIYTPLQANNFVIRAYNGNRRPHAHQHQQYLRESPPSNKEQQSHIHPEQTQEAAQQQYVYLPEAPRGQQQIFRPAHYSKQGPIRKPQSIRPVQLIQEIPQYAPHPYPLIPEDQLLKLLEEELASKGITNVEQNQQQSVPESKLIQTQAHKPQQHQPTAAESQPQAGLGNYRQHQQPSGSGPDNLEYIYLQQQQQQQQPGPQQPQAQQYYAAPFLQHRPSAPATLSHQPLYPSPQTHLDYHRSIPNHPLAESSLEKEIEKLFAPKKQRDPVNNYEQPQIRYAAQPQYQAFKTPKPQPTKSYGTTPSPTEKQYSFLPSLAEFSGFKQEDAPELELQDDKSRQYLPKAYPTRTQYLKQSLANKQSRRTKPQNQQAAFNIPKIQQPSPTQFYAPIHQIHPHQHHHSQSPQNEFIPIPNPNQSKNSAMKLIDPPSLQYEKQRTSPVLFYNPEEQHQQQSVAESPQAQQLIASPHPSHSSIFVSQGTGLHPTTPQPSQSVKAYGAGGEKNGVRLPPPNGKPITQEEFQALVDAGYPVQAVPVPVPVPYERYIKDHPEYKEQQQTAASNQHNSRAGGITYLRPIHDQQNEDDSYEKNS